MPMQLRFAPVLDKWPLLAEGAIGTITLSAQCFLIGLTIALVFGTLRAMGLKWVSKAIGGYVEVIRNTPLLVQLLLIYFGLPALGFKLDAEQAAVIGIGINLGAYATEIIRAGLIAIPRTQIEAGLALGMHPLSVIRHIIMLPALKIVYPALTSQLTLTLLGTSIASAISASELMTKASFIDFTTFRSFETYIVVGIMYVTIVLISRGLFGVIGFLLFRRKTPPKLISVYLKIPDHA